MEFDCPVCHAQLAVQGNSARCERCAKEYVVEARCPDCHKPLEVLKACGAIGLFLPEWPRADFEKTRRVCADLIFIADAAFAVAPEFNQ